MKQAIRSSIVTVNSPCDRRVFLRRASAAALAFTIVKPWQVRGSEANSRLEVGCIGLGARGNMIADMIKAHGGYQIKAMADYFPDAVEPAAERLGVPKAMTFSGLKGYQLLLESKVDAVFLETPPYCFPEHAAAAVGAGCHVYMAKPIACDVAGCLSIEKTAACAKEKGKVFLVDFQMRVDPLIIEAARRIHAGEYGKLSMLSSLYMDDSFSDPEKTATIESRLRYLIWVNDDELGGGYLVNAGIHAVDMALWLAQDKPLSATGSSRLCRADPHGNSHDVYSITYEFANGLILNHRGEHLRNNHGFSCQCEAWCTDGHMIASYEGPVQALGIRAGYKGGEVAGLYQRGAESNISLFHKNVSTGNTENTTVPAALNATLATILGREAGINNSRLTWEQMLKDNRVLPVNLAGLKD